ncbi:uncharacterized protein IUM83_12945 [Phytophthora cinnamomi]|uniref:uncharacterized protein n=1 Tax=Phytophthora cinnamomi TaxID=4785 RepID=UPI00355A5883|nr:hypothetical protein IUM83_12945 [Phytophthora cinnamomi]
MNQKRSPSPTSSDALAAEKPQPAKRVRKNRKHPTKRFLWQEELHLRFVAAIFDLGLKNASPKALLPLMQASDPDSGLTTEHLKSHLQKYRINYERSRQEFRELCDREVKRNRKRHRHDKNAGSAYIFPLRSAKDRGDNNSSGRNETDSDTEPEVDGNASSRANSSTMGGEDHGFVYRQELANAALAIAAQPYPTEYPPVPQAPVPAPVTTPELTDAQWQTFCLLMSATPQTLNGGVGELSIQVPQGTPLSPPRQARVQEELHAQMHDAMQAQMHFHRQMLMRKVELSHNLGCMASANGYPVNNASHNFNTLEVSRQGFEQAWASSHQPSQQSFASNAPHQVDQCEAIRTPMPPGALGTAIDSSSSLPSLISTQPDVSTDAKAEDVGDDFNRWEPFNVDLDGDDLFDFLRV